MRYISDDGRCIGSENEVRAYEERKSGLTEEEKATLKIKAGWPAFPVAENHTLADALDWTAGMTLREYYAGVAMQGLLSNAAANDGWQSQGEVIARSVEYAELLISALEATEESI